MHFMLREWVTWRTATSTTLQLRCCVEKFKKVLLSGHADLVAGTTNAHASSRCVVTVLDPELVQGNLVQP